MMPPADLGAKLLPPPVSHKRDRALGGMGLIQNLENPIHGLPIEENVTADRTNLCWDVFDDNDSVASLGRMQDFASLVTARAALDRALHLFAPFPRTHPLRKGRDVDRDDNKLRKACGTDDVQIPACRNCTQYEATGPSEVIWVVLGESDQAGSSLGLDSPCNLDRRSFIFRQHVEIIAQKRCRVHWSMTRRGNSQDVRATTDGRVA